MLSIREKFNNFSMRCWHILLFVVQHQFHNTRNRAFNWLDRRCYVIIGAFSPLTDPLCPVDRPTLYSASSWCWRRTNGCSWCGRSTYVAPTKSRRSTATAVSTTGVRPSSDTTLAHCVSGVVDWVCGVVTWVRRTNEATASWNIAEINAE